RPHENPEFDKTVGEFGAVDVVAAWPDAAKEHRLDRAKRCAHGMQLRDLATHVICQLFAHALVARSAVLHLLDCPQHCGLAPLCRYLIPETVRRPRDPARKGSLDRLRPRGVDPNRARRSRARLVEQELSRAAEAVGHEYDERACVLRNEFAIVERNRREFRASGLLQQQTVALAYDCERAKGAKLVPPD